MSQGRCQGCGHVASDVRVRTHQMYCPEFAELCRRDLAAVLTPEQEYEKWVAGGRKASRDAAHQVSVADTDRRREAMAARFASRDLLED